MDFLPELQQVGHEIPEDTIPKPIKAYEVLEIIGKEINEDTYTLGALFDLAISTSSNIKDPEIKSKLDEFIELVAQKITNYRQKEITDPDIINLVNKIRDKQ